MIVRGGSLVSKAAAGRPVSVPANDDGSESALDWDGTGDVRSMLYWYDPFPIYGNGTNASGTARGDGVTYLMKVYPREITRAGSVAGDRYWTFFFWGNGTTDDTPSGVFSWDGGVPNTYYGAHPYPNPAPNGSNCNWEISVLMQDITGPQVEFDRWYTQAFRAWRASSSVCNHEYYWDLDLWTSSGGTQGRITYQVNDSGWADTNPPVPMITVGQAAWMDVASNEECNARIRSIQFFDTLLSVDDCIDEHATPGATGVQAWFRCINPKSDDVQDRSGRGNHGTWRGTAAPTWTP